MQSLLSSPEFKKIQDYSFERYGIPMEQWSDFDLVRRKEGLWLCPKDFGIRDSQFNKEEIKKLLLEEAQSIGIRIFSGRSFPYKVTAQFYQVFCKVISKGKIAVNEQQAKALLFRETLEEQCFLQLRKGYYFCLFEERFIAIGLVTEKGLVSQVPKSFTAQLGKDLKLR